MPHRREDPISMLSSGESEHEPAFGKSLNKGEVNEMMVPDFGRSLLQPILCVKSSSNPVD